MTTKFLPVILSEAVLLLTCLQPVSAQTGQTASLIDRLYDSYGLEMAGFSETRWGARLVQDADEMDMSIGEGRIQIELNRDFEQFMVTFKGDLTGDAVLEEIDGSVRDFSVFFTPADNIDVKLGRMVSTWGTGDLVFINDMFPKDWQSFFIGRNDEYLKQASNIIKTSLFAGDYALDLVYTPLFQGSEYVRGERLSYYNPVAGKIVGRSRILDDDKPGHWFSDIGYCALSY